MPPLPTGTVTFLFTDIEASTRLLRTLGSDRYHQVLLEHQRLLRAAFAEAGGREIDTQGDSFFFAFPRAKDAVMAAIAGQRNLQAHDWPDGADLRVRMGLDTGEPTVGDNRYVGLGVNRTARIMAAGHGGQVLVSGTTRDLVQDDLPTEVSLRDLGEQHLKDIERPVRLYQVVASGLPDAFPPLRALPHPGRPVHRLGRRRMLLPLAGFVAAGIVAVLVVVFVASGGGGGTIVRPNSLGIIDPKTDAVVGQVGVGIRPGAVAVGGGSVWVANEKDRTLDWVDVRTRAVQRAVPLNETPTGVTVGYGVVWIAEGAAGIVARFDPRVTAVTPIPHLAGRVRVSGTATGSVAVGAGAVWAAFGSSAVARIDPRTRRGAVVGAAGFSPSAIAYGEDALWIANRDSDTASRFSTTTDSTIRAVSVGRAPEGVAVGGGFVWVTDSADAAVSRVDPRLDSSTTIPVGRVPLGIAYGAGGVWVANAGDGTVSRIDPSTSKVVKTIKVGGRPVGIAVGDGLVWVTVEVP